MFLWLGPTDMAAIFAIALLLFGPDQLPKVARQLGDVMRHMQNTTQSFMLEMDRAARDAEFRPNVEPDEIGSTGEKDETGGEGWPEEKQSPVAPEPEPPTEEVK
ncbi:MAG TPA: twin-arginine translocase TatA/TatE family subunit [Candidatus Eremiobacteraceae bacterium]|jgi:Sec-independent protein translocase protein TatA